MFRTKITPPSYVSKISLQDKIITVGSCFSDAIGDELQSNKFDALVNPFGTSYNPISIHKVLLYSIHNLVAPENTFLKNQDIFSNYDFHSSFSALNKIEVERKIKETIGLTHYFLKDCNWIIITYGTAWVYERKDTGEIVSNCHKVESTNFNKVLLNDEQILESFNSLYKEIKSFNPECKFILTVSPVRHIKDTLPLNSTSKALLRIACQQIIESYSDVFYFPSFEIMMDDLRDYRFYKPDLIHPSEQAEEYIWNIFEDSFFDASTKKFIDQWKVIRTALNHKPFHPSSAAHQKFLQNIVRSLEELQSIANVEKEIDQIKSQIIK